MADFVNELMKALRNKEVRAEIKKIANDEGKLSSILPGGDGKLKEENKRLRAEIEEINGKLAAKERQALSYADAANTAISAKERAEEEKEAVLKECRQLIAKEREKYNAEISSCKSAAVDAERRAREYENSFKALNEHYLAYMSLSDEIHRDLERVLSARSAELFLSWGVQWSNLEALWDFISYKPESYSQAELEVLTGIFDYLFDLYADTNAGYVRLDVNVGDEFDEDVHTRAPGSAVYGRITKVLLRGYRGANGKIKKSMVRV